MANLGYVVQCFRKERDQPQKKIERSDDALQARHRSRIRDFISSGVGKVRLIVVR